MLELLAKPTIGYLVAKETEYGNGALFELSAIIFLLLVEAPSWENQ